MTHVLPPAGVRVAACDDELDLRFYAKEATIMEQAAGTSSEVQEVHNAYTIYGREADGTRSENSIAEFHRPQDWGEPERWHYELFRFEWVTGPDGVRYINNAHCWTDIPGLERHEYPGLFAGLVTVILLPGSPAELCGRTHLQEFDDWDDTWGPMPPDYEDDEDDED